MAIPFHEKIKPPPLGGSPNEATGKWKYNPLKSEITAVMIHTDTYYTRVDTNQLNYMRMWKNSDINIAKKVPSGYLTVRHGKSPCYFHR